MKNILLNLLSKFSKATYSVVSILAHLYDLRQEPQFKSYGKHSVILDSPELAKKQIPKSVYFNTASGMIKVGENTVFGEDVKLLTGKHLNHVEAKKYGCSLHDVPKEGRDIIIGKNCYIGTSAIIIGPIRIADNTVIGAGSVVTKDTESNALYVGNPARKIKEY